MDGGDEGGGPRLSKRIADGEVDYKSKSGTAWSHSFLNQKPWHPLSYPNQRRKWIAEQTHAQRSRRSDEISREYAQEQEFFRQTALISKKEKEKVELMQAVSFMYVRPPGYNAESAKAAEIADERRKEEQPLDGAPSLPSESVPGQDRPVEEKRKQRPKDVFGRPLPTEEEFEALKNAPRLDTGVQGRAKPFGIEIRNVRCVRCGNFGHQSGDRECPLKDAITPNEQSRIKRDDPLTAILAHTDPSEPLKWELKQKPGVSPPRGGFKPDDPNQQIVAEDIYDEYGGFLSGGDLPELLANFTSSQKKKKHSKRSKHKRSFSPTGRDSKGNRKGEIDKEEKISKKKRKKSKQKREHQSSDSSSSAESDSSKHHRNSKHKHISKFSENSDSDTHRRCKKRRRKYEHSISCEDSDSSSFKDSYFIKQQKSQKTQHDDLSSSEDSDSLMYHKGKMRRRDHYYSSDDSESIRHSKKEKSRHRHYYSSEDSDSYRHRRSKKGRHRRRR